MALKIFKGFALDEAADLSGLHKWEISRLKQYGVVVPKRTKQGWSYSFTDLLMLRLVKQLRENGVKLANVRKAHEHLSNIDPEKSLRNHKLYIRSDTKDIVYFGQMDGKTPISASQFGQLLMRGVLIILPVGVQLEAVRKNVIALDKDLDRSMRSKRVISLDTVLKRHGLA